MKKKLKRNLIIGLIILIAIIILIFNIDKIPFLALTFTSGCSFVENPNNPNSTYTKILQSSSYTCNQSECLVSGSLEVNQPSSIKVVVFRYSGDLKTTIYVDTNNDEILESWTYSTVSQRTDPSNKLDLMTPNGYFIYKESGNLFIKYEQVGSSGGKFYKYTGGTTSTQSNIPRGTSCPNTYENCITLQKYDATFNFCPSNDPNFAYCSGSLNTVSSSTPQVYYTEEKKIIRGESISFTPKNKDGSEVTNKFIRIKEYDCSCLPNIELGNACSSEQLYCKPQLNTCPSGYTSVNPSINPISCINSFRGKSSYGYFYSGNPICTSSPSGYGTCTEPTSTYAKYQKCDSTKTINQATCKAFSSALYDCPTGQQCFVTATGQTGTGLGGCRCPTDPCILGSKQAVSTTTYKECINIGTCLGWSSEITCTEGLIFNDGNCVCDNTNDCNPQEAECVGTNQIRKCETKVIGDKTCYQWKATAEQCLGEYLCDNKGTGAFDDICNCRNVDLCIAGKIQCTSTKTYLTCSKNPDNVNSCLKFRDLNGIVSDTEECVGNEIKARTDIGCAYGTPPESKCSELKDTNGILIEQCINNNCISPTDGFSATELNFLNQNTKCSNNVVQKVSKYNGNKIISYRWETKTDAENSINGLCKPDFFCAELITGKSNCVISAQFIGILSESSYGINKPINNILVTLTDQVPNKANKPILARLLENNNEISGTRINTFTDSQGKVTLNFNYQSPRSGEIVIEVIAGDPAQQPFKQTKTIKIQSTLEVKITCPAINYINRDITCSWKIQDLDTKSLVDVTPKINLMQGTLELDYTPIGKTGLAFQTEKTGSVLLKVLAEKEGYVSDTDETTIAISSLIMQSVFELDNKDYFTYATTGITSGTHQLVIKVEESGVPVEVHSIDATITTPSGQVVPLLFNKVTGALATIPQPSIYKATYNFIQAGNTYELNGKIIFSDITKESVLFNYKINTIGTTTEDIKTQNTLLIVSIIGAVLIIIITIGIIIWKRKK